MIRFLSLVAALFVIVPALAQPLPANLDKENALVIDTTKGRVIVKLRPDLAPKHVERMKLLARDGYYNNVPFHRVIDGFMAQTGDGEKFNGTGGSKYPNLKAEFTSTEFKRGVVGMARSSSPDLGEFAVLHHVRRNAVLKRQVHGGRRSRVGHAGGRQDEARRARVRPRQDGEGPGRCGYPMSRFGVALAAVSAVLLASMTPARAQSEQLNTINDVFEKLYSCWEPPPRANPKVNVSVIVTFRRDGSIFGQPKVTYESEDANDNDRLLYRVAIMHALERCTPLSFSDALGGALAGRPFALRLGNRKYNPQRKERDA